MPTTRPHLGLLVLDTAGNVMPATAVTITKPDGSALAQSLYAVSTGGAPVTTHVTDNAGRLDRFVPIPARALITPAGGTARLEEFFPDPADILIVGDTQARTLDGYTGTSPVLKLRSLNAAGTGLLVANVNDDTVFKVGRASSNDVVIFGDDGTTPTTNMLYVVRNSPTSYDMVNLVQNVTAGLIIGNTLTVTARQTVTGISNAVGGKFTSQRTGSASANGTAHAVEGVVNTTNSEGISFAAFSTTANSGARNRAAFQAGTGGGAGYVYGFEYFDTNGSTQLATIGQTGNIFGLGALLLGTLPAAAGQIRLPNATGISANNAAHDADINLARTDASNNTIYGAQSGTAGAFLSGTTGVTLNVAANTELAATTIGVTLGRAASLVGLFGSVGAVKGTITGSRGGNAALASLLTYLASLGALTDSSS